MMSEKTHKNTSFEDGDFVVFPPSHHSPKDILNTINQLKKTLKKTELSSRRNKDDSEESFLLRTAINSDDLNRALYRKRSDAEGSKILAWISIAKDKAQRYALSENITYGNPITVSDLLDIASLSSEPENIGTLSDQLKSRYGIILITEKYIAAMKMDGCSFRLSNGVPVVGVTTRYNRYDNFWFTLMHELSHVCLHYEELDTPIVDNLDDVDESELELEANRLASDSLVPRKIWRKLWLSKDNHKSFKEICKKERIHPAIPAGMIRYKTKNYKLYPEYNKIIDVRKSLGI